MRRAVLLALPVLFAAAGYVVGVIVGAPPGADHSCPPGAPGWACRYPPDTAGWELRWTLGGLLAGAVVSAITAAVLAARSPRRPAETAAE
jgi:hypothetical protein